MWRSLPRQHPLGTVAPTLYAGDRDETDGTGDGPSTGCAGAVRVARRPPLTYRRAPRPGNRPPAARTRTAGDPLPEGTVAPGSEAFRSLRRHIRLTLDHRLRCGLCRRPPQRRRCADGERLEALRREADRSFGSRRRHSHRAGGGQRVVQLRGHPVDTPRSRGGC